MKSQVEATGGPRRFSDYFRLLWRGLEWLSHQIGWISGGLVLIMMIAVVREVLGRYLFANPSDWSLELSCYLVVAMGYLSAAFTELKGRHIRIDFLYDRMKGKTKLVADIIISAVGLLWSSVLVWQGSLIAFHSLATNARSETIMKWPLFPVQVMVPIGATLLCLVLIAKIVRSVSSLVRPEG